MSAIPDPSKIPAFVPLGPPPPGVKSNFAHPDLSHQHQITAGLVSTLTIALTFVLLRLTTRAYLVRTFGWDDYMCMLATALTIVFNASVVQIIKYDLGYRDWDISLKEFLVFKLDGWVKWNAVTSLVYLITFGAIKLSILFLYLRLFGVTHKKTRMCVWALIALTCGIIISGVAANLSPCHPVKKLFVFATPGVCDFSAVRAIALSSFQLATDVLIILVPLPMTLKLQLPLAQKLGVMAMLSTGLFVTAISAYRLSTTIPHFGPSSSGGLTVNGQYPATFWSVIEINLALTISCMPAVKQFLGLTVPAARSLSSKLTSRSSKSGRTTEGSFSRPSKFGSATGRTDSDAAAHLEKGEAHASHYPINGGRDYE